MERLTERPVRILAGLLLAATLSFGQSYTISAKPGAVNYVEGATFLNGNAVSDKSLKATFLNANDTFSTEIGKAEVLLTPGVFLRVGENSEVRMISPSLTDTKVELIRGEIMVEASGLVKDNNLQILDHGALITIIKNGLYKFTADNPPTAAVLDGKADVSYGDRKVDLKKGRETILASNLATQKFDTKQEDDLYAWSNVRSEYEAAASYRVSRNASLGAFGPSSYGGYGNGLSGYGGYGNGFGPGWYWDNGFSSYAWLPGNGVFYSPFGYGFYSPGYVGYAPVMMTNVYRGGRPWRGVNGVVPGTVTGVAVAVPVSTKNPPAVATMAGSSPYANHQARQSIRAYSGTGNGFANSGGGSPVSSPTSSSPRVDSTGTNVRSGGGYMGGGHAGGNFNGGGHMNNGSAAGSGGGHVGGGGFNSGGGGGGGHMNGGGNAGGGGGGHTGGGGGSRGK